MSVITDRPAAGRSFDPATTTAILVTIVAFFNSTKSEGGDPMNQFTFDNQTFPDHLPMWHEIANGIADDEWPQGDLFSKFFGGPIETLVPPGPEVLLTRARVPKLKPPDFRRPELLERRGGI